MNDVDAAREADREQVRNPVEIVTDTAILITHGLPLDDGVAAYDMFKNKSQGCIRFALRP
ncbi:hypothetical protein [Mycobacterium sp. SMC-4]|uniref:hypothetical protein n=1 Tax=Mycobacterium sp. SMC-4 TaxID=2857059 RepID=UPI0021B1C599|nr:hypothetical protein [Mycobacterium sp. SMC-4]UXA21068.1 hypothetical protein KXD98_03465 [Mycobacterium sp. SMC-4]